MTTANGILDASALSDLLGAASLNQAVLLNPLNGLHQFKQRIMAGQNATALFVTDSTGIVTPTRRYPAQWADQLGAITGGTHSVDVIEWTGVAYGAASRVFTGSTSAVIPVYVFAVSGSAPRYMMGPYWRKGVQLPDADFLFLGHGINMKNYGPAIDGEYVSFIEWYRFVRPRTPIIATTQHPNQADNSHDTFRTSLFNVAAPLGVNLLDGVYQAYLAAGKPTSLYNGDAIHESTDTGVALYVAELNALYQAALPVPNREQTSALLMSGARHNLLLNGGFNDYVSGTPTSWAVSGTITVAKDTSQYFDERRPYSLRLTGSGAAATILSQQVNGGRLSEIQGATITLMAIIKKDASAASTVGRIQLAYTSTSLGSQSVSSVSNNTQMGEWEPFVLTVKLPSDVTALTARVYHDTSATPDATNGLYLDQVMLMAGLVPMAAR